MGNLITDKYGSTSYSYRTTSMHSQTTLKLPQLNLKAVKECYNPIEEESPIPSRCRSSALEFRKSILNTPHFALECHPIKLIDQINSNPYRETFNKVWHLPT